MAGEELRTTKRKQRVGVEGIAREKRKPARVKASFRGFFLAHKRKPVSSEESGNYRCERTYTNTQRGVQR